MKTNERLGIIAFISLVAIVVSLVALVPMPSGIIQTKYLDSCGLNEPCEYFYCEPTSDCYQVIEFPQGRAVQVSVVHYACQGLDTNSSSWAYLWKNCYGNSSRFDGYRVYWMPTFALRRGESA